ncbi:MAG: protein kinase, partial [Chlamydiales bacterium]|nr:protein kinase [Chlamydiales bacterium]
SCYYDFHQNLECWMPMTHLLKIRHNVLLQIAEIVQAFHSKGVLIIDLKPSNILITKDNKVLFCDPDSVLFLKWIQGDRRHTHDGGSPAYIPPELIVHGSADGKSADVFAFGCIIFELCFAHLPWVTNKKRNTDRAILDAYKLAAFKAKNVLEWLKNDKSYSLEDTLFKLSNWAMNTRGDARPTIETCIKILQHGAFTEEPMEKGVLDAYLSYEVSTEAK